MNETWMTIVGNVASDVRHVTTEHGVHITSFRVASNSRRFDRGTNRWVNADTLFATVTCWRQLAENAASSLAKGMPVVAHGRIRQRTFEREDGKEGHVLEVDAVVVGHDLTWGTAMFRKAQRAVEHQVGQVREPGRDSDQAADGAAA